MKKRLLFLMTALIVFVGAVKAVTPLHPTNTGNWLDNNGTNCDSNWGNDYASASEFTITTAAQLAKFSLMVKNGNDFSGKTVSLSSDINMNAYYWYPISNYDASFKGSFNGNGHTISGIITTGSATSSNGLFGIMYGGTIKNLKLSNSWIQYNSQVYGANAGAIVGHIDGGSNATASTTIKNCHVGSDVTVYGNRIGGIVGDFSGSNHTATIEGCISYAKLTNSKNYNIGGIIGKIDDGTIIIKNCVYGGESFVIDTNYTGNAGAIYGSNEGSLQLTNNFCISTINEITEYDNTVYQGVKATPFTVSVSLTRIHIGYSAGASVQLTGTETPYTVSGITAYENCMVFNNTQYARIGGTAGITIVPAVGHSEVTNVQYNSQDLTITDNKIQLPITLDVTNYSITGNVKFIGSGTEAAPYEIWNTDHMTWLADYVNQNISYGGYSYNSCNYKLCANLNYSGKNYLVIGTYGSSNATYDFEGIFDGQGHTISNVTISSSSNDCVGLFSRLWSNVNSPIKATVKNLTLSGANITGHDKVGGIVGSLHEKARVINCHVINSSITGNEHVGGIAGIEGYDHIPYDGYVAEDCVIEGCTSTATVTGSDGVGGILGLISKQGQMDNCLYLGAVSNVSLTSGASGSYGLLIGKSAGSETYLSKNYYCADGTSQQAMDIKAYAYSPVENYTMNATLIDEYEYNGIKAYANPTGLVYGGYFYSTTNDLIASVTLIDGGDAYNSNEYAGKTAAYAIYRRTYTDSDKGKYKGWFLPFNYTITADAASKFAFFKIVMIDTSVSGGEGSSDKQYIHLEKLNEGDVLYGNRPYVYRATTTGIGTYDFTAQNVIMKPAPSSAPNASLDAAVMTCATTEYRYIFYGVLTESIHPTSTDYFYYMNASGKFSLGTKETTVIKPYRWIFRIYSKPDGDNQSHQILPGVNGNAPIFEIVDSDNEGATVIESINHETSTEVEGYYTLDGVKVQQMTKGIYIVKYANGSAKKIVK